MDRDADHHFTSEETKTLKAPRPGSSSWLVHLKPRRRWLWTTTLTIRLLSSTYLNLTNMAKTKQKTIVTQEMGFKERHLAVNSWTQQIFIWGHPVPSLMTRWIKNSEQVVQWFRLHDSTAGEVGSIPGGGTKISPSIRQGEKKNPNPQRTRII